MLLAERAAAPASGLVVALPAQLSVSRLVELAADPGRSPRGCAARCRCRRTRTPAAARRSMPGSSSGSAPPSCSTSTSCPAPRTRAPRSDELLEELQEAFLASRWAEREPYEVEVPFETVIDGIAVRGRMDAVFADADGGWTVVDWKTGALPDPARRAR